MGVAWGPGRVCLGHAGGRGPARLATPGAGPVAHVIGVPAPPPSARRDALQELNTAVNVTATSEPLTEELLSDFQARVME